MAAPNTIERPSSTCAKSSGDKTARPAISVGIHDTSLGIWQDDANDPSFRDEVFLPLLKALARRRWKIRADPRFLKRHRVLSPSHRLAARGDLRAEIRISGRVVEIKFWAETWPVSNPNGRRYDFDKLKRMVYLDRLRVRLEMRRILDWLRTIAPIAVKDDEPADLPPLQRIERRYAESWHTDKALGRPRCDLQYNRKSGDGGFLEHGSTVWFADRKGHVCRGTVYYNINNMWWVVAGGALLNLSSGEIFCQPPADLRTKVNGRLRRERLETELAKATRRMDFRRAETLKHILFGDQPTFLIWARDHSAYYCSNYSGYTTDTISAGRYTRSEAMAEVRRVPHELEAIGADGERLTAPTSTSMVAA